MVEIALAGLTLLGVYLLVNRVWRAGEGRSELIAGLSNSGEDDHQGTPASDEPPETK